jgi:hypothetical protein
MHTETPALDCVDAGNSLLMAADESHTSAENQLEEQTQRTHAQDDRRADQHEVFAESKDEMFAESKDEVFAESKDEVFAESKDEMFAESKDEMFAESKDEVFADATFLTLQPEAQHTPAHVVIPRDALAPQAAATMSTAQHPQLRTSKLHPHPPASKPQPKPIASSPPRKASLSKLSQTPRKHVPSEAEKRVMARTTAYSKQGDGNRDVSNDQHGEDKVNQGSKFIERVHDVGLKVLASFKHRIRAPQLGTLEVGGHAQTSPLLSFSWMDGLFDVMAAYAHKRGALEVEGWQLPHTVVIRNSRPVSWFFSSHNSDSNLIHFSYEPEDLSAALLAQVFADAAGSRAGGNTIVAQLLLQQDVHTQGADKDSAVQIEYMTCAQVEHYLSHTVLQDRRTALLQAFVPPAGDHNMTIRASFTAHMDVQIQVRMCHVMVIWFRRKCCILNKQKKCSSIPLAVKTKQRVEIAKCLSALFWRELCAIPTHILIHLYIYIHTHTHTYIYLCLNKYA